MGEFRIGRSRAQHSYPEPRFGGAAAQIFARNFASGPELLTALDLGGTQVPWNAISSGAAPGTNVPITPQTTGVLLISGVITVKNNEAAAQSVRIAVNGVPVTVPTFESTLVASLDSLAIPFLVEAPAVAVGVTWNIAILVTPSGNNMNLLAEESAIEIQEVPVATG